MRIDAFLENQLFQSIFEASPAGMVMVNAEGLIVLVNPQALLWFGYRKEELIGQPVETLVPLGQRDAHVRHRARYMENACPRSIAAGRDLTARCRDGSEFPVDISLHPIESPAGRLILANILDASQRQQAELVPRERLAAIGEMISGLAHESRNALQRARACLDLLELDLDVSCDHLDLTARIRRALGDLERNYEEVRGYAAPIYLEGSEANLVQILQEAFDDLQIEFGSMQFQLQIIAKTDDSVNRVDIVRMKQVFRNLFANSMAASEPGSAIIARIALVDHAGKRWQQTAISDFGIGIPPEHRDRVFAPFFTTKQSGTGLGLAICRRIIEAHGGMIEPLAAMPVAKTGTTIQIELPVPAL